MSHRTCAIDACLRPTRTKSADWCGTHYFRWYRNGDPLALKRLPNTGTCDIEGCEKSTTGAHRVCSMHIARTSRHGSPDTVVKMGRRTLHPSYRLTHRWITEDKGRACQRICLHCAGEAEHWAYDHSDPNALVSPEGREYSTDPARYIPLCRGCHGLFDAAYRAGRSLATL
jgi:hypothetical protein